MRGMISFGRNPIIRSQNVTRLVPDFPIVINKPVIAGTGASGTNLNATQGTFRFAASVAGVWFRGVTNTGITALTYLMGAPDIGQSMTYRSTGTNLSGSTTSISNAIVGS